MKYISVAVSMESEDNRHSFFAVFQVNEQHIRELRSIQSFDNYHDFPPALARNISVDLEEGGDDFSAPGVAVETETFRFTLASVAGERIVSETIQIDDLTQSFVDSSGGELLILGCEPDVLWGRLNRDAAGRWKDRIIGYQVVCRKTGLLWDDEPSFMVLTSAAKARKLYEDAHAVDSDWILDPITLSTVEEPMLV